MSEIHKYPRTRHIEGSGLQPGDDPEYAPFADLAGRRLVVEEKMDGANSAISFAPDGRLLLQSRGHYLTGGPRERQFDLLKQWANRYAGPLWETLGDRYVLYGEWLYARHTIFYTDLPHYFLEFDIYDRLTEQFLDTPRRAGFLRQLPFMYSVKVLSEGAFSRLEALTGLVGPSAFIADGHLDRLRAICEERGLDAGKVMGETDNSLLMEGLYVKIEEEGRVQERYKYVRASFLTTVLNSRSHWMDRPLIPNQLRPDVDLFGERGDP
jgi:RNA ligase